MRGGQTVAVALLAVFASVSAFAKGGRSYPDVDPGQITKISGKLAKFSLAQDGSSPERTMMYYAAPELLKVKSKTLGSTYLVTYRGDKAPRGVRPRLMMVKMYVSDGSADYVDGAKYFVYTGDESFVNAEKKREKVHVFSEVAPEDVRAVIGRLGRPVRKKHSSHASRSR